MRAERALPDRLEAPRERSLSRRRRARGEEAVRRRTRHPLAASRHGQHDGEQGGERQDAPTPAAHGAPRFTARPAPPVARLAPDGGDPPVAPQNGPQRIRTGGISSSRLSTTSVSMSGRNQRAHFSQGIFAMPSTPMVTAEVGRIGLTSSQSW